MKNTRNIFSKHLNVPIIHASLKYLACKVTTCIGPKVIEFLSNDPNTINDQSRCEEHLTNVLATLDC